MCSSCVVKFWSHQHKNPNQSLKENRGGLGHVDSMLVVSCYPTSCLSHHFINKINEPHISCRHSFLVRPNVQAVLTANQEGLVVRGGVVWQGGDNTGSSDGGEEQRGDLDGHVVGFGGSAGEDDLSGICANQISHLLVRVTENTQSVSFAQILQKTMLKAKYRICSTRFMMWI